MRTRFFQSCGGGDFSRRNFFKGLAVSAAFLCGEKLQAGEGGSSFVAKAGGPKNIIFLVSDGMSPGVLTMAEAFSWHLRGKGTRWVALQRGGTAASGLMETASLNSLVTDSAAASSCWGSGSRVNNGSINQLPDGTLLTPIAKVFRDAGKKIGLVTTATVTHATPAGFAASVAGRDDEEEIASQYLGLVDVALGGGDVFFDPSRRKDRWDLFSEFSGQGYEVVRNREALLGSGGGRCLGVFFPGHLPYSIDRDGDKTLGEKVPTLAEMTQTALQKLSDSPGGFLLQVEGARIDHAAHQNDIATLLREQLAFDDALGIALDFAEKRGDTLVVITSDHGNSNPGLKGMGSAYSSSTQAFEKIGNAKESFESLHRWTLGKLGEKKELSAGEWAERMAGGLGLWPSPAEAETLLGLAKGVPASDWNAQHSNYWGILGQVTGNQTGIGWVGTTHTMDPTILTAVGPGAGEFGGYVRNDEIFGKLCSLSGIEFRNPRN